MQALKAAGLQRYNELATKVHDVMLTLFLLTNPPPPPQYKEYEDVVVEHRAMKEKQRIKAEQDERERKAATKVTLVPSAQHSYIMATSLPSAYLCSCRHGGKE